LSDLGGYWPDRLARGELSELKYDAAVAVQLRQRAPPGLISCLPAHISGRSGAFERGSAQAHARPVSFDWCKHFLASVRDSSPLRRNLTQALATAIFTGLRSRLSSLP